jgi:diadenosine tetraphosphate (Ap4A) HIT family hydrolase
MDAQFSIDQRLLNNTVFISDLALSRLFIQNDARFPWFVLIPRVADITELYQLSDRDQIQLMTEITQISRYVKDIYKVHKVNVGALGNIVPQLHIHIVGRNVDDVAWPGPVWGVGVAEPYVNEVLQAEIKRLQDWV